MAILELAKDVELHRGHTNLPGLLIVLWFRLLLVVDRPDHFPGSEQRQVYCNVRLTVQCGSTENLSCLLFVAADGQSSWPL